MKGPDGRLLRSHGRSKDTVAKEILQGSNDEEGRMFERLSVLTDASTESHKFPRGDVGFSSRQAEHCALHPLHLPLDYDVRHVYWTDEGSVTGS